MAYTIRKICSDPGNMEFSVSRKEYLQTTDREVIDTSRRLRKLIREEEKTVAKIAELQEYLEEIRASKKMEEDDEILKSFRSMDMGAWDLYNLTTGIQKGNISMDMIRKLVSEAMEKAAAGGDPPDPTEEAGECDESNSDSGLPGGNIRDSRGEESGDSADPDTEEDDDTGQKYACIGEDTHERKEDLDEE